MTNTRLPRLAVLLLLLGATGVAVSGCNTIEGLGRDVEAAGSTVADTASDTKEEITE